MNFLDCWWESNDAWVRLDIICDAALKMRIELRRSGHFSSITFHVDNKLNLHVVWLNKMLWNVRDLSKTRKLTNVISEPHGRDGKGLNGDGKHRSVKRWKQRDIDEYVNLLRREGNKFSKTSKCKFAPTDHEAKTTNKTALRRYI